MLELTNKRTTEITFTAVDKYVYNIVGEPLEIKK